MESQRVAVVYHDVLGKIEISLDVLGKGDIEQRVFALVILMHARQLGQSVKHVAGRLYIDTNRIGIADARVVHQRLSGTVVSVAVARADDETVLVVILQDVVLLLVEESLAEAGVYPRHVQVVDVQQVDAVLHALALQPPVVTPAASGYDACELRTHLMVILQAELRGGAYPAFVFGA